MSGTELESLTRVLREEGEAVLAQIATLDETFVEAVRWIGGLEGRLITCGVGKSGHIAQKSAATFASTGTPSFFLHAGEALHGDLGMVTGADIVLLFTYSGETDEVLRLFPAFRTIGARTIAMTGRETSSAATNADLHLRLAVQKEACPNNLAPTTSTTCMLAMSDALAVAAMESRGFGAEQFARFHPAGALGRRLTMTVGDVMRTGDDLAVVTEATAVMDVLRAITRAGAGGACVVDAGGGLIGFISDGDVRRHFLDAEDPRAGVAAELMTRTPFSISEEMLAFDALDQFRVAGKKIGEMPVVGPDGALRGLLVLKDLLRAGLM